MSEERLHQVVGKMAIYDMTPAGKNDFVVKGDIFEGCDIDVCYKHFTLDLREPAPSVQSTLQQVQNQQQVQEADRVDGHAAAAKIRAFVWPIARPMA
ncbi:hypothetical protein [Xanthomonas sp. MUS 060]|uniref:hypothetical protein n=1 Tax=Xanthomonas sp. MUS 060 TaxID=1588031 RepID=UPI0005F29973|nr:hypothetical protein [Xanthomonas sp. MUS 060]